MRVRDQLVLVCAGALAVQLAAAAGETLLGRQAARHHASSRAAHEQVEQLIRAQAELGREVEEAGDLALSSDPAEAAHGRRQIAAAQSEVNRAVRRYTELIADETSTPEDARGEAAAAAELADQIAAVHAAVDRTVARGGATAAEVRAASGDAFGRAVASLDQLLAGERSEMLEDDLLAAQAAAFASIAVWVAPLLCGAILAAGIGLAVRAIGREQAAGADPTGWVADADAALRRPAEPAASAAPGPDQVRPLPGGVLHDVGAALELLAAAAHDVRIQIDGARTEPLARAARALDEHRADLAGFLATPRGAELVPALIEATARLTDDLVASADDLVRFEDGIERVRALVAAQERRAGAPLDNEPHRLGA